MGTDADRVFGWAATAAALLLAACVAEPDYTGASCDQFVGCPAGYVCDLPRFVCAVPVDACATANGGCDPHAACAGSVRGRICTCREGFLGDGLHCTADDSRLQGLSARVDDQPVVLAAFDPAVHLYQVTPPPGASRLEVVAVLASPASAHLTANGIPLASGTPVSVPVVFQEARVVLVVAGASGATTTYAVLAAPPP